MGLFGGGSKTSVTQATATTGGQDNAIVAGPDAQLSVNVIDPKSAEEAFRLGQLVVNQNAASYTRLLGGAEVLYGEALKGTAGAYDDAGSLMLSALDKTGDAYAGALDRTADAYSDAITLQMAALEVADRAGSRSSELINTAYRTADQKIDSADMQKMIGFAIVGAVVIVFLATRKGKAS